MRDMRDHRAVNLEAAPQRSRGFRWAVAAFLTVTVCVWGAAGCDRGGEGTATVTSLAGGQTISGDLARGIGTAVAIGDAVITVNAFQDAFQPAAPVQKLSDETPVAPAAGESFYQAYVRVENRGQFPLRVDPEDFVCRIGNAIRTIEGTRSGPPARSIIYGTSLDVVVTFKGRAGADPVLIYSPPWYDGDISFSAGGPGGSTATSTTLGVTTSTTVGQ
jgi:hypothetical protein